MLVKSTKIFTENPILLGFIIISISGFTPFPQTELAVLSQRSLPEINQSTETTETNNQQLCQNIPSSNLLHRTELFLGSLRPNGSEVTDPEFLRFLNFEVTPRFPEGLTLLTGQGQFRNSQGMIIKERSRLLILLYSIDKRSDRNKQIEQIRQAYKAKFQQESVLRTDSQSCVSF